jgi:hypothetical protein
MRKRRWGFVIERNRKTGKPTKIELYDYEKLELARYNVNQCKEYSNGTSI